ncbi:hypothetical protein XENORESO_002362, partial [Xenotaenia resolanae]
IGGTVITQDDQPFPLNMAENSVDDMYSTCATAMEAKMPPELPVPEGDRCNLLTAHQEVLKETGQSELQYLSVLPMWFIPSPGSSPCESTSPSTRNLKKTFLIKN